MTIQEATHLFAYGSWANGLMFDAASTLNPEEYAAPVASSFQSVAATLTHLVSAEWVWLQRWLGTSPHANPWTSPPPLADLRARLTDIEAERTRFLASLADEDLEREVAYKSLAGQPFTNRLADLVRHSVNHSTYHRGQVATQLRQLGRTPPTTDLIAYLRLGVRS